MPRVSSPPLFNNQRFQNAGCLSQSRCKLQQRMVASEMAICYSQSDRFKRRSSRTMTGRCRSWMRTWQRGNMPILLKTQIERTAKAPVTARRARVGGLCGFHGAAERVPAKHQKTGRCADVRHKIRPKPSVAGSVERGDAADWTRSAACGGARDMELASTKRRYHGCLRSGAARLRC